jgi:hypothetical protein
MTPTKRTLRPRVPTPPKKAKTTTRATPPKKATSKKTAPPKQSSKKHGRDHDAVQFFKHVADLCPFRSADGTARVTRTHPGKNNSVANWVAYMKKKKAAGKLPIPHAAALDGIKFEWKADREPKKTLEEWFHQLEEYKKTFNTVLFLGEQRNSYKTLAAWTSYAKLTAIKVLKKLGNNSEFTLISIKNLVDIGGVPPYNYSYGVDSADEVEGEDEEEYEVEDERNISAVEEITPVIQQTLHLALAIVEVPVKKN